MFLCLDPKTNPVGCSLALIFSIKSPPIMTDLLIQLWLFTKTLTSDEGHTHAVYGFGVQPVRRDYNTSGLWMPVNVVDDIANRIDKAGTLVFTGHGVKFLTLGTRRCYTGLCFVTIQK